LGAGGLHLKISKKLLLEAFVLHHELDQTLLVGLLPFELHFSGIKDLMLQEQLSRGIVVPVFWERVLGLVKVLANLLNRVVLLDELNCLLWADSFDGVTIIATQKDAKISELVCFLERERKFEDHTKGRKKKTLLKAQGTSAWVIPSP